MARGVRKSNLDKASELSVEIANLEQTRNEKVDFYNKKISDLQAQREVFVAAHKAEQMDEIQAILDETRTTQEELLTILRERKQGKK